MSFQIGALPNCVSDIWDVFIEHGRQFGSMAIPGRTSVCSFVRSRLSLTLTGLHNLRYAGEIDILEGVNDQGPNQATLHTDAGTLRDLSMLFIYGSYACFHQGAPCPQSAARLGTLSKW